MGADIVVGEGQSIGNALNFGGPYVGLFATPREIRAPDAGAAGRRDRRCRRQARLRADAVDARAAHPPREGDHQHLHQFRPVRARLHDPSVAARRGRAARGWRELNHADGGRSSPSGSPRVPGVELVNRQLLQRVHACACRSRRRRWSRRWPASGILAGVPVSRGSIPDDAELADLLLVAATETVTDGRHRPRSSPGSKEVL